MIHWIIFDLVFTCLTYCIKLKATANISIFMNKRYWSASCLLSYPICWHLIDCWQNSSTAHGGKQLNSWTHFDGTEVAWKLPEEMRKPISNVGNLSHLGKSKMMISQLWTVSLTFSHWLALEQLSRHCW